MTHSQVGTGSFQVAPVGQRRRKAHRPVALLLQQVATAGGQQALHDGQGQRVGIERLDRFAGQFVVAGSRAVEAADDVHEGRFA